MGRGVMENRFGNVGQRRGDDGLAVSVSGSRRAEGSRAARETNVCADNKCWHGSRVVGAGASCRCGCGCGYQVPARAQVVGAGVVEPRGLAGRAGLRRAGSREEWKLWWPDAYP